MCKTYLENYKILMRETIEDCNKYVHELKDCINVRLSVSHKLIYRFSEIKILWRLSCRNWQLYMEVQQTQNSQDNLKEGKQELEALHYSISWLAVKLTLIECGTRVRTGRLMDRVESRNRPIHIYIYGHWPLSKISNSI